MEYTIQRLASLAGVSTRTLRYYHQIGLLTPAGETEAGYRLYGPAQVDRLQLILFYRALGLPLGEIAAFLDAPGFDRATALEGHLAALEARRGQLDDLILTVRQSIATEKGEYSMTDTEKFKCFQQTAIAENEAAYGGEVRAHYGDAAMDSSNARMAALTPAEYEAWSTLGEALRQGLEQAVRSGTAPDSPAGLALAQQHRRWLEYTWADYTPKAHAGLAALYTEDPRFTAYYDRAIPGCAALLRDAVLAYTAGQ